MRDDYSTVDVTLLDYSGQPVGETIRTTLGAPVTFSGITETATVRAVEMIHADGTRKIVDFAVPMGVAPGASVSTVADYEESYDYPAGYCEACRTDHSTETGPELDRHDAIEWTEEGRKRTGRVVSASQATEGYWVDPDELTDHHEVEVLVGWHYLSGWVWQRTYYDDHLRSANEPKADYGYVTDDYATYPLCKPGCGLQVVQPGKVQCDCEYDGGDDE